jgi:hypothetical protein
MIMIGPNEWISHHSPHKVVPNYEKPEGYGGSLVEIKPHYTGDDRHEGERIVYATLGGHRVDPFFTPARRVYHL